MRLLLLVLAGVLCASYVSGQDLIVTDKGDSVNCKITKFKPDYIYFTYKHENEIRNTLLPVGRVTSYVMNFYPVPALPAAVIAKQKRGGGWLAVRGGWGYRTAPIPDGFSPDAQEYLKKLKSGLSIYADAGFNVSEALGFGLIYSGFFSADSDPSVNIGYTTSVSDRIQIHYVGPGVRSRFGNADNHYFTSNFSLGMMTYRDDAIVGPQSGIITGKSFGMAADFGMEFLVNERDAFVLSVSVFAGTLNKLDITIGNSTTTQKLDDDERENLTRINLSLGFRLNR